MSKKPTFDDVRTAVIAVRDRLGLEKARSVLNTTVGEGTKLADAQHAPACWSDILAACAAMEAASPPPPVSSRPLVQHKASDLPPNAVPLTLYMGMELWTKLNDARPDNVPLHVYVRGLLEAIYK